MNMLTKGITVAALHLLIVLSLGGKLLYDRANRPRVWVKTASVDPDLPIRGRYLTLNLLVRVEKPKPGETRREWYAYEPVELTVEDGKLVARTAQHQTGLQVESARAGAQTSEDTARLTPPVAFFLPEHAEFPRIGPGVELWAEVTVPKKGPPRPIQLAIKRGTEWTPLSYR